MRLSGLLLAAGAGRRMGRPKALLRGTDGVAFLDRTIRVLLAGGCPDVTVVLGAGCQPARELLSADGWHLAAAVRVIVADDWAQGMGASLRTGLRSLAETSAPDVDGALVILVDLPDVGPDVVRRVAAVAVDGESLVRATYDGRPGHPVVLGRAHWEAVAATARGDHGARDYLRAHLPSPCECGDLATGRDVDHPEDLVD